MHDSVQYDPIQGQAHKPFKVGNPAVFKSYHHRHLQWELATDHRFLNYGIISQFNRAGFLILGLVFVSCDLEVGTNVRCKESTVSPHTERILIILQDASLMTELMTMCIVGCAVLFSERDKIHNITHHSFI